MILKNKSVVTGLIFFPFSAVFEIVLPCGSSWTWTSDLPAPVSQSTGSSRQASPQPGLLPLSTSCRPAGPSWGGWKSKENEIKLKHSRPSNCPKSSHETTAFFFKRKIILKKKPWNYTYKNVTLHTNCNSFTSMWNQPWYLSCLLLLSYQRFVFAQEICQRVSQDLDSISFTSNYNEYLEFTTAVSTVLIIVLKLADLKNKTKPEVIHTWYLYSLLFGAFKRKNSRCTI